MSYFGLAPTPPLLWDFWRAAKEHVESVRMNALLGGEGRIYTHAEDYSADEAQQGGWGRLVLLPVRLAWGLTEEPGRRRRVRFLARAEFRSPGPFLNVTRQLELIQAEAFRLLHGWHPTVLDGLEVVSPVGRHTSPTPAQWDQERGLWWMSAEYLFTARPEGE